MLLLAFQFFGDQLIEPGPGMASGNRQGVSDRPIIRAAVAHDANAINAQKRRSAKLAVVVFLGQIGQGVDGFIPLDRKAFTNFSGNHFQDKFRDAFTDFKDHISGEPVANDDIDRAPVDVSAFHISLVGAFNGGFVEKLGG